MGRVNGENAGKAGIFLCACSPFGLDRVLILNGFQPESRSLTGPRSHILIAYGGRWCE